MSSRRSASPSRRTATSAPRASPLSNTTVKGAMSRTGTPGSGTLAHPSTPSGEYKLKPANIMFDPRVVRGNTWAASTLAKLKEVQAPATPTKPAATRKKRVVKAAAAPVENTPRPVSGRQHFEAQTDPCLQDLQESAAMTQTEAAQTEELAPAVEPLIPHNMSCDAMTQIETGDLPDPEEEARKKAAEEAAYWAAVEEEQQATLKRQQEEEAARQAEEAERQAAEAARLQAEAEHREAIALAYAQQYYSCEIAVDLAQELMTIAAEAAATFYMHDAADAFAVQRAQAVRKAGRDMDHLLNPTGGVRHKSSFNVAKSQKFETLVDQVEADDGDDVEESVDGGLDHIRETTA
ncbi:hypothetical protein WJX73_000846 [Symbiochloris irregularis]|uniref:Uncharacterized protein n=1 Tax=Symbiochloris irregularis TaxID=706552 RepID=A0AAW1NVF1_9CHLO